MGNRLNTLHQTSPPPPPLRYRRWRGWRGGANRTRSGNKPLFCGAARRLCRSGFGAFGGRFSVGGRLLLALPALNPPSPTRRFAARRGGRHDPTPHDGRCSPSPRANGPSGKGVWGEGQIAIVPQMQMPTPNRGRGVRWRVGTVVAALCFIVFSSAAAQTAPPQQVFLTADVTDPATGDPLPDSLTFVDVLTGATVTVEVPANGRYLVADGGVWLFDANRRAVDAITPDGTVTPHPFIDLPADARRLDWVLSGDGRRVAWTLTSGPTEAIATVTRVADVTGANIADVFTDGPRDGIRAMPVAFSADGGALYMDYQPDTLGDFTPYNEYAGLFEVSLKDDHAQQYLLGEPGCYCGGGFGGGAMVRLSLAPDFSGFDLRVVDLQAAVERRLDALALQNYTQGGDVLVSPDGTLAVYALAQVQNFGAPSQTVRTVFVLADLTTNTQRQLTQPQTLYIRPVAWTEGNNAVLFTSPTRPGTWKMDIESGQLTQISNARWLGTIGLDSTLN